ncbi:type II toxin-antitoxin system RelE/ParE family toxin [Sodalis ligni]|uniref:type II toxin-antitoxin system RelE/ParE family toxin n=1 Tax=Sodalis ligni TaxID=2697027 RepID=UPI00193F9696|nr:type II toxin-antitoxin system RelE/ParE family toxin [Sodalis ligni]QWA11468.1 type II toxin-antitoxin system RelE/ParE family toxin [Sodalis ligni]
MTDYRVVFAPEANKQLIALYDYIADAASAGVAQSYTDGVVSYCESLAQFPYRGNRRDELLPGLRITHYRKRTIIAIVVNDEAQEVNITGFWHGGRQYESAFEVE